MRMRAIYENTSLGRLRVCGWIVDDAQVPGTPVDKKIATGGVFHSAICLDENHLPQGDGDVYILGDRLVGESVATPGDPAVVSPGEAGIKELKKQALKDGITSYITRIFPLENQLTLQFLASRGSAKSQRVLDWISSTLEKLNILLNQVEQNPPDKWPSDSIIFADNPPPAIDLLDEMEAFSTILTTTRLVSQVKIPVYIGQRTLTCPLAEISSIVFQSATIRSTQHVDMSNQEYHLGSVIPDALYFGVDDVSYSASGILNGSVEPPEGSSLMIQFDQPTMVHKMVFSMDGPVAFTALFSDHRVDSVNKELLIDCEVTQVEITYESVPGLYIGPLAILTQSTTIPEDGWVYRSFEVLEPSDISIEGPTYCGLSLRTEDQHLIWTGSNFIASPDFGALLSESTKLHVDHGTLILKLPYSQENKIWTVECTPDSPVSHYEVMPSWTFNLNTKELAFPALSASGYMIISGQ